MKTLSFFMLFVALGIGAMFAAPEWSEAQCGTRCTPGSTVEDFWAEQERNRERWRASQADQAQQRWMRAQAHQQQQERFWQSAEDWGNFNSGGAILGEPMGGKRIPGAQGIEHCGWATGYNC